MKNIFVFIIGVILITSCSNGLEKQAKEQLKKTMKEMLKNPDSATLTNVKTELNNDSLCIIHFICKGQNGFGGYTSNKYEYIYIKINDKKEGASYYKESLYNLEDAEPVVTAAKELQHEALENAKNEPEKIDKIQKDSIGIIYIVAYSRSIFRGRKVEKDTGDEIKLK